MTKGQAEIMGLIMITIIGGLVIAFALVYISSNIGKTELAHERFAEKGMSANFVTVISKTYVSGCDTDFETLVRDCATNYDFTTPDAALAEQGRISCNEAGTITKSCHFLNTTASEILNNTLDVWGVKYNLKISRETNMLIELNNNCSEFAEKEAPGRQIVPLYPLPEQAFIVLEVCK